MKGIQKSIINFLREVRKRWHIYLNYKWTWCELILYSNQKLITWIYYNSSGHLLLNTTFLDVLELILLLSMQQSLPYLVTLKFDAKIFQIFYIIANLYFVICSFSYRYIFVYETKPNIFINCTTLSSLRDCKSKSKLRAHYYWYLE